MKILILFKNIFLILSIMSFQLSTFGNQCPQSIKDKILQVSPSQFEKMESELADDSRVKKYVAPVDSSDPQINLNFMRSLSVGSSKDSALIVFAVVGIVVVVLWVPYVLAYSYDALLGESNFCPWYQFDFSYKNLSKNQDQNGVERQGHYKSLGISLGSLVEKYKLLGLKLKLGHHIIKEQVNGESVEHDGMFFLIGPRLNFRAHKQLSFALNLLAGTSDNNSIGFMSEASFEMNYAFINDYKWMPFFSLSFGADYFSVDGLKDSALDSSTSHYSLFLSAGLGFQF